MRALDRLKRAMSATYPCFPCTPTAVVTNVPGIQGNNGANGTNGINAYTFVNGAGFTVPTVASPDITITVDDTSFMVVGEVVLIQVTASTRAYFRVKTIVSAVSVVLTWLNYPGDAAAGAAIADNALVSPAGERASPLKYRSTAVDYTAAQSDEFIETTADGKTITLPKVADTPVGKVYIIKQTAAFAAGTIIDGDGAETIDGAATKTIGAQYKLYAVMNNGAQWLILYEI